MRGRSETPVENERWRVTPLRACHQRHHPRDGSFLRANQRSELGLVVFLAQLLKHLLVVVPVAGDLRNLDAQALRVGSPPFRDGRGRERRAMGFGIGTNQGLLCVVCFGLRQGATAKRQLGGGIHMHENSKQSKVSGGASSPQYHSSQQIRRQSVRHPPRKLQKHAHISSLNASSGYMYSHLLVCHFSCPAPEHATLKQRRKEQTPHVRKGQIGPHPHLLFLHRMDTGKKGPATQTVAVSTQQNFGILFDECFHPPFVGGAIVDDFLCR